MVLGKFAVSYNRYDRHSHCPVHAPCSVALSGCSSRFPTTSVCISVLRSHSPSVQFSSVIQSSPTLCNPMNRSTPGLPVHHQLLEFTETHVHRVGDAIQPSHPLSSPSPPVSIFPSIRVLPNELVLCIKQPKHWSFSFSISPSNEYLGLISFNIDCFDLLAVQGTLESLLQQCNSKASVLWCSAFFLVHSHI